MFNEPGHDDAGPWQCPYCGTRLNAPLILCPECGANQLAAAARVAAASEPTPDERARGVAQRLREHWNTVPGNPAAERLDSGAYPSIDEERMAHEARKPRYVWAGLAVFAVALTSYAIVHRDEWEPKLGAQVVVGSVLGPGDKLAAMAGRTPVTHGGLPRHGTPAAAGTARANMTRQSLAQQKTPAAARTLASPGYAYTRPDVARNLAIARASLDKNTLWPAHRAIMTALAEQPGNTEAQQMRDDLAAREQQRDVLIGHARLCAHERQWACVRLDAGHAVSVDASSREARHLLMLASAERRAGAGRRAGWKWPWDSQTYAQTGDARPRQDDTFLHH